MTTFRLAGWRALGSVRCRAPAASRTKLCLQSGVTSWPWSQPDARAAALLGNGPAGRYSLCWGLRTERSAYGWVSGVSSYPLSPLKAVRRPQCRSSTEAAIPTCPTSSPSGTLLAHGATTASPCSLARLHGQPHSTVAATGCDTCRWASRAALSARSTSRAAAAWDAREGLPPRSSLPSDPSPAEAGPARALPMADAA